MTALCRWVHRRALCPRQCSGRPYAVAMPSLTVGEATVRSRSLRVRSYDVHLDLTRGATHFGSRTVIEFASLDHQDTFVEIAGAELVDVHLNQLRVDPELRNGRLHLTGLRDDNVLVVEVTMPYSRDGEGLHRSVDREDGLTYVYAATFLDNAPRVFACFDQPDLKAPYRLTVTAPEEWTVLSNGRGSQLSPGTWSFAETPPLPSYLVTVVAGPYHSVLTEHDGIQLGLHCRRSLARYLDQDAAELFDMTRRCFDEYHRLFGIRYPFGDYHQAFVPEFNGGAMENPGCVAFRDDMVFRAAATDSERAARAVTIAHEMAHMWFGDLVTMTWWDDLWLNESFADYMGYRVTADVTRFADVFLDFGLIRKPWGMAADQRSSTHPVAGNGVADTGTALNDFDGISYAKGAAVLRQLRTFLGDESFLGGVTDHLTRHAYGNARLADLLDSWERVSGVELAAWSDAWLRTAGLDTLECRIGAAGPEILRLDGSQPPADRPHALTVAHVPESGVPGAAAVVVTEAVTPVVLSTYDGTGLLIPDSGDETWAKLRLDPDSLGRTASMLPEIDDPVARTALWGAVREGLLDGHVTPDLFLDILESALPHESDMVVETLLGRSVHAWLGTYLAGADHRDRIAGLAAKLLAQAEPGSNRQLLTVRLLIDVTSDVDLLQGWRGDTGPEGLVVDDDFRWRVLRALAEAGHAGVDDITALSHRDPSSQGALHALASTASIPDPATKAEVWDRLVRDDSLRNYEAFALAQHFFRPGQTGLTAAYVGRYFQEIPATSTFRQGSMAEHVALLAYPRLAVDASTVAAAESCLAGELDSAVRRPIADRTDDLRRLLEARTRT